MADKFLIRLFQPIASVVTDPYMLWAATKDGDATRTELLRLTKLGLFHQGYDDFLGISTPATPASGHCKIYGKTSNGHTNLFHLDQDGTEFMVLRDSIIIVRNSTGSSLAKGTAVYFSGATGQIPNVAKAAATAITTAAVGMLAETIANGGFGLMFTLGEIQNLDTSAFTDGAQLFLSDTAGAVSTTRGTYRQGVGVVVYAHATQGIIFVYPDTIEIPHHLLHESGGADSIKLDDLAAPDDNTDLNASTSAHGLLKKLSGTNTEFLDGSGAFDTVKDSDLSLSDITTNNASTSNHGFLKKLDNDSTHFMDGTGNWTSPSAAVVWSLVLNESGSSLTNWTQTIGSWSVVSSAFHVVTPAATVDALRYTARLAQSAIVFQADVMMESTGGFTGGSRLGFSLHTGGTQSIAEGIQITMRCTGNLNPASTGVIYIEQPNGLLAGPSGMAFLWNLDQYYTLRVVAIGPVMDVYVDGVYTYTFSQTPWRPSDGVQEHSFLFLYAYNCKANFKNIKGWTPVLPT